MKSTTNAILIKDFNENDNYLKDQNKFGKAITYMFLSSEIISTSPYPETIHPIHKLIAPQREMAFFAHILLHGLAKSSYYKELTDEIHC